jgi:Fe2+ transport system protein FeoA
MTVLSARADSVSMTRRLAEMGIRPGVSVRILSRTSGGGAILAIADDRIAVARSILAGIHVAENVPAHG